MEKTINSALISVYHKQGLDEIAKKLDELGVTIYSTGGTQRYLEEMGIEIEAVEDLTAYPSILGGRVKTLHPKVFGGILSRRDFDSDVAEVAEYDIPDIDLVIVDLYPFEETVASTDNESEIIEKIDIGGISLIRAAAKNYKDVWIVPSQVQYGDCLNILQTGGGVISLEDRQRFAAEAFAISSHYDTHIFAYFNRELGLPYHRHSLNGMKTLRYGENPHQQGSFVGRLEDMLKQVHGKELSYNNLLDVDAAVALMADFQNEDPTIAILKHNNACGLATRGSLHQAWIDALAGDPISAFGGILISNKEVDLATADEMNKLFCEVVIAPGYQDEALEILKSKKNRIILIQTKTDLPDSIVRTALNGLLIQDRDAKVETEADFNNVTDEQPNAQQVNDLLFANKIVKHTKSNTIVLAKNGQLLASGTGQTSRVDALKQAITKARHFNFELDGAVMASDAFFPFPDCVEIAHEAGIKSVIQPGGSIKDQDSIDFCNKMGMSMVTTGTRHFKH